MFTKSIRLTPAICGVLFSLTMQACDDGDAVLDGEGVSSRSVVDAYIRHGVTCETADYFILLSPEEQDDVINTLLAEVGEEGIHELVEYGGGCASPEPWEDRSIPPLFQLPPDLPRASAMSEWVEESSFSEGAQALNISRDGASAGWMCNGGKSATLADPADYLALFHVDGAYSNRSDLRIRGTTLYAKAYISKGLSSRVYYGDYVLSCIGYWRVQLTGSIRPVAWELRMKS